MYKWLLYGQSITALLVLLLTSGIVKAQYIANPDFELHTTCPSQPSRFINNVTNWISSLGGFAGTPDYLNTCGFNLSTYTPNILPQSGDGFAGLYAEVNYFNGTSGYTDYKEYITSQLSSPLVAGITYTISFYTAHLYGAAPAGFNPPGIPAPGYSYHDLPATEQGFLGLVFSAAAPVAANTVGGTSPRYNSIRNDFGMGRALIPASNTTVYGVASRNAWQLVTLSYTAVGGEQFMTVGQFRPGSTSLSVQETAYYLFDNFSFGPTLLPVRLQQFTATAHNNGVLLDWTTLSEQNNTGFFIERSTDGMTWDVMGFVNTKAPGGNSYAKLDYRYTDSNPVKGKSFYRLKQVDMDGKFEYSRVQTVNHDQEALTVYPNPVNTTLRVSGLKKQTVLQVLNTYGQVVKNIPVITDATISIDMAALPTGLYILQTIHENGKKVNYKVIKK